MGRAFILPGKSGAWLYANLLGIPCFVENSAGDESLEYSGSTGDREFRDLTLMGILKLNSVGDIYSKVLALLRSRMMYCRGFLME